MTEAQFNRLKPGDTIECLVWCKKDFKWAQKKVIRKIKKVLKYPTLKFVHIDAEGYKNRMVLPSEILKKL